MYVHKDAMSCIPQDPLSIKMRIIALILSYTGLISVLVSYIYPSWSTFNHNGQTGSLGIHKMCADESDGSWDCRDVSDKGKLIFTDTVIYVLFVWEIISVEFVAPQNYELKNYTKYKVIFSFTQYWHITDNTNNTISLYIHIIVIS